MSISAELVKELREKTGLGMMDCKNALVETDGDLEKAVDYQIQQQIETLEAGGKVIQETAGWNETEGVTFSQRSKEEAHDYRYFPEPDLPPLWIDEDWLDQIRAALPELPAARLQRFQVQYGLSAYDAGVLIVEPAVADYFEDVLHQADRISPKMAANWISGELFSLLNQANIAIAESPIAAPALASLLFRLVQGEINQNTAKAVLGEMFTSGKSAGEIIQARGLQQISDVELVTSLIKGILADNPQAVQAYLAGKETIAQWLFGQVMRAARGTRAACTPRRPKKGLNSKNT